VVAMVLFSADELAAGHTRNGVAVPDALDDGTQRPEAVSRGDFEGMVAGRQIVVRAGAGQIVRGGGFQRLLHAASLQVSQF